MYYVLKLFKNCLFQVLLSPAVLLGFFVFGWLVSGIGVYANDSVADTKVIPAETQPELMLLSDYDKAADLSGWVMSEKLDGVRAYWDGRYLLTKQGNRLHAPNWFIKQLPDFALDGELWLGRGQFAKTLSIVMDQKPGTGWHDLSYQVFEVPNQKGDLLARLAVLQTYMEEHSIDFVQVVAQTPIQSKAHVQAELSRLTALGAEGLVIRDPNEAYTTGRLNTAQKVKIKQDAECVVTGYTQGKGQFTGLVGALKCELLNEQVERLFPKLSHQNKPDRPVIKIGSGLSHAQRQDPPKIGTTITFQYMGTTKTGLPRFPVFLRQRMGP